MPMPNPSLPTYMPRGTSPRQPRRIAALRGAASISGASSISPVGRYLVRSGAGTVSVAAGRHKEAFCTMSNVEGARQVKILAVVAFITAALAMPVEAGSGRSMTTANLNLRTGAGVDHMRITTLPLGTEVSIDRCQPGWCLVEALGVRGWASARYLATTGIVEPYRPPVVRAPPAAVFDFVVPRNYHDFGYSDQHRPNRDLHEMGP